MLTETAEMYAAVTAPHISKVVGDGKSLSWLFNVLSKEKEADRVLYEDEDPVSGAGDCLAMGRGRDVSSLTKLGSSVSLR